MFASLFDQSSILVAYSFNFIGKSLVFFSILFFNHAPHILIVRLTLQNYCYILLKLVSMSKKNKKKCKKMHFFLFFYVNSASIFTEPLPNPYRSYVLTYNTSHRLFELLRGKPSPILLVLPREYLYQVCEVPE